MFLQEKMLVFALFVYCQLWFFQPTIAGSFGMQQHPQAQFCQSDFVFRFVPTVVPSSRTRRGLLRMPVKYEVDIERFYKGRKEAMIYNMNETDMENEDGAFGGHRSKVVATMMKGMYYMHKIKKDKPYIFFGRRNKYIEKMPPEFPKYLQINDLTTIPEEFFSKIMIRGLRKKYHKGCKAKCTVMTSVHEVKEPSKNTCYWVRRSDTYHCRKLHQFCIRGRDGKCFWKRSKDFLKCMEENAMP